MTTAQKMQADLLLLQKVERNMEAMTSAAARRMGVALVRIIITAYNARTAAECQTYLKTELEKMQWHK